MYQKDENTLTAQTDSGKVDFKGIAQQTCSS